METPTHIISPSFSRQIHYWFSPEEEIENVAVTKHDALFWNRIHLIDFFYSWFTKVRSKIA